MRKTFLTLVLTIATALAINAQSLTGKQWCAVFTDEDGENITAALTFEKNGTCEFLMGTEQVMKEDGVNITIYGGVTIPGTYNHKGNDLNTKFNKAKATVDVDYEIQGLDATTKALMDKQIKSELEAGKGELKNEMLKGMPKMDNLKIVSLEANKLVVKNYDNQEISFYVK